MGERNDQEKKKKTKQVGGEVAFFTVFLFTTFTLNNGDEGDILRIAVGGGDRIS